MIPSRTVDQLFGQDGNGPTPSAVERSRPQPVQPGSSGSVTPQPVDHPRYGLPISPSGADEQPIKTYSFVALPGNAVHRRLTSRPRYGERYRCNWDGCTKSYSTLNHLNTHITMQEHDAKRTPNAHDTVLPSFFIYRNPVHCALIPLGPDTNRSGLMDNMDEYLGIDRTESAVSRNGDVIQGDDAGTIKTTYFLRLRTQTFSPTTWLHKLPP
ncbi:hypothetical protein FRB99_008424 [Tulasnella sp. 403]|nr:hypothetical protein FRB99_008424 [Tulasnella sp. 403]